MENKRRNLYLSLAILFVVIVLGSIGFTYYKVAKLQQTVTQNATVTAQIVNFLNQAVAQQQGAAPQAPQQPQPVPPPTR